ncbi:MAG: hypothetical protein IPJ30_16660 [Acidobacteria bacterium]|nr:hypothetical protein [Acidobacteriota bacterium]
MQNRKLKGSQGNVISRRAFKPFGEEISSNTGERTITAKYGAADNLRQKFTTYQREEETGLDFADARMCQNRHGRFTAVDPLLASGKSANPQRSIGLFMSESAHIAHRSVRPDLVSTSQQGRATRL